MLYHYSSHITSNCKHDSLVNVKELFNLCCSSAHNIIEWIFGVLKNWFSILMIALHYNIDMQSWLAPALVAIYNFIQLYDPDEILDLLDEAENIQLGVQILQMGDLVLGLTRAVEKALVNGKQDDIAQSMWAQYQGELVDREGQ